MRRYRYPSLVLMKQAREALSKKQLRYFRTQPPLLIRHSNPITFFLRLTVGFLHLPHAYLGSSGSGRSGPNRFDVHLPARQTARSLAVSLLHGSPCRVGVSPVTSYDQRFTIIVTFPIFSLLFTDGSIWVST